MRTLLLLALLAGACSSRQPSTPPPLPAEPDPSMPRAVPSDAPADTPATAPPDAPLAAPTDAAVPPDAMLRLDAGVLDKTYGKTCKLGERHQHDRSRKVVKCGGGLVCCYPCGVRGCDNTCMTEQECRDAALRP